MALSKIDNIKLKGLQSTLDVLVSLKKTNQEILEIMSAQIKEFEQETNHKIMMNIANEKAIFITIDLSKDYLRTRNPNEESQVLRAKVQGIMIEIKIQKENEYNHTNKHMAESLIALSEKISEMSTELNILGSSDIKNGETTSTADDQEIDDQSDVVNENIDSKISSSEDIVDLE
jgi:hypothetical protein